MSYKGSESEIIAYLYGELEGKEKDDFEQYLLESPQVRLELEKLKQLCGALGSVEDKEVITPVFVGDQRSTRLWNAPYFKTIMSIAASLLVVLLVGKFSGLHVKISDRQLNIGFGTGSNPEQPTVVQPLPGLTPLEVQNMIQTALSQNNATLQVSWEETQKRLDASVKENLALNSTKINDLVRASSEASQDQIRLFVAGLQTDNMQMVKNYFQLSSNDQKQYIEGLLVDFAKYLQQQRNDDLQVVQTQLNSMKQNTDVFKQETEQILTSIISTVGTKKSLGTRN